ncbi:helix-turn-helix domain-containing protein [Egibacter rhizosphaerae]|uniref:Helix-turn-helix domain-containing protein n=1 Tax=Egibacter rhizosphaerae TaxID=1670831 RepID=A0A411YH21_9ACTN|nr:helix-turn-helix domain-containing protein [Egibacter rhizosphaerae]QBI20554.1 helix-turn-helix domain-containing protein [Egibacter rhizosphaerae]
MSVHAEQMGRPGRKAVPVVLTGRQCEELEGLVLQGGERERVRARIVLGAAEGRSNRELTDELGCSEPTVSTWRRRFAEQGMAGLADARSQSQAMARRGPKVAPVVLPEADRAVLQRWTRRSTVSQGLVGRPGDGGERGVWEGEWLHGCTT